jgi:hypothetical protein
MRPNELVRGVQYEFWDGGFARYVPFTVTWRDPLSNDIWIETSETRTRQYKVVSAGDRTLFFRVVVDGLNPPGFLQEAFDFAKVREHVPEPPPAPAPRPASPDWHKGNLKAGTYAFTDRQHPRHPQRRVKLAWDAENGCWVATASDLDAMPYVQQWTIRPIENRVSRVLGFKLDAFPLFDSLASSQKIAEADTDEFRVSDLVAID